MSGVNCRCVSARRRPTSATSVTRTPTRTARCSSPVTRRSRPCADPTRTPTRDSTDWSTRRSRRSPDTSTRFASHPSVVGAAPSRDRAPSCRRRDGSSSPWSVWSRVVGASASAPRRSCRPAARARRCDSDPGYEIAGARANDRTDLLAVTALGRRSEDGRRRATSKDATTRVSDRFACWPPGPPDVVTRSAISSAGIVSRGRTSESRRRARGRAHDSGRPGNAPSPAALDEATS